MVSVLRILIDRRWLSGPTLGLVVAVVFVAHDAAMAGAVPASPANHAHSEVGAVERHPDQHGPHRVDVELPEGEVVRDNDRGARATNPRRHHGDCGVAPDAATAVESTRRFSERERSVAIEAPVYPSVSVVDMRRDEAPTWSPAVRRALIQLYRI